MDYNKLLEKYWDGKSSIADEQALKAYFNSGNVPEDLKEYAPLFQYIGRAKEETLSTELSALIIKDINKGRTLIIRSRLRFLSRIAAAVLLLLSITFIYTHINQPTKAERLASYWAEKEIKDPKLAYQKTKAALMMVSKKLNGGTTAALNQVRKVQEISPLNVRRKN